jgi:hypothetical protein
MGVVEPLALGMMVEELYCLLSEHPIYLGADPVEWTRVVQRKTGQLRIAADAPVDDGVVGGLDLLARHIPQLSTAVDQIAGRSELAAIVEHVMGGLAARQHGPDRAAYDTGIFVTRISLCANVVSGTERRWRRQSEWGTEMSRIYRAELRRAAEALNSSVRRDDLPPSTAGQVQKLLELALSGRHFHETHELAEVIMADAGFSRTGPLPTRGS